jgi:hypothetical protein
LSKSSEDPRDKAVDKTLLQIRTAIRKRAVKRAW